MLPVFSRECLLGGLLLLLVPQGDCSSENNPECMRLLCFSPFFCCVLLLGLSPTGIRAVFMSGVNFHSAFNLAELLCVFLEVHPRVDPLCCRSTPPHTPVKLNLQFFVMWALNLCRNTLGKRLLKIWPATSFVLYKLIFILFFGGGHWIQGLSWS